MNNMMSSPVFSVFSLMTLIIPVFVIGMFIFVFVKIFSQWHKNNKAPMLSVQAAVVDKYPHHSHSGGEDHHSSTRFYAVFEVESGDRMEFHLSRQQYSQIIEGDFGTLVFQGTRFLEFQRMNASAGFREEPQR